MAAPEPRPPLLAGVELGGTKCVCILADADRRIVDERRVATTGPRETLATIAGTLAEWRRGRGYSAIGVAGFGPLDLDPGSETYGFVTNTPKPGWRGTDLLGALHGLDVPVALDTDVNGAAFAEQRWGAARGLDTFAYITVGTGIGVGSIVGGKAVRGFGHSEAGHMIVRRGAGSPPGGHCPFHGDCVEGIAAGPAIAARAGMAGAAIGPDHPVWNEVVVALTGLLHNLVLTVCPQRIIIGGGVASGQPHLFPRLRASLEASLAGYAATTRLTGRMDAYLAQPELGQSAGPLGAIALGLNAMATMASIDTIFRHNPGERVHSV